MMRFPCLITSLPRKRSRLVMLWVERLKWLSISCSVITKPKQYEGGRCNSIIASLTNMEVQDNHLPPKLEPKQSNKPPNNFFNQELKQSFNYEAESIIEKKNFLAHDTRLRRTPSLVQRSPYPDRPTTTKLSFYQQQISHLEQINQSYISKLATTEIQLKQYHFDILKMNEQIGVLEGENSQLREKLEEVENVVDGRDREIEELESKARKVQEIIQRIYGTISDNSDKSRWKDLEYVFNTDSSIERQLETICYVMLQCCRQNTLLRKTLDQQDSIITKLDQKTSAAQAKSVYQLEATSKLMTQMQHLNTKSNIDPYNEQLSPFRTPVSSKNSELGRSVGKPIEKDFERNRMKSDLVEINMEIDRLQFQIMKEMKH